MVLVTRRSLPIALALLQTIGCAADGPEDLSETEQALSPPPQNLTVTQTGPASAHLQWDAVPGATGYAIRRGIGPGNETAYTSNSPPTATTFNDSHLATNTQY